MAPCTEQQGQVRFAFTSALNPDNVDLASHHAKHGDGVRDVAIRVKDCRALYDKLVSRGAASVRPPSEVKDANGAAILASIRTYGDTVHTLVELQDYDGPFLPGFEAVTADDPLSKITASPKLEFVDHVVGNQPDGSMEEVCKWYEDVMGFKRFWSVDDKQVTTKYSSLRSVVMTDADETVKVRMPKDLVKEPYSAQKRPTDMLIRPHKMPINEPADGLRKSQIQEFVDYYDGPGVQHIALRTFDIVHTVRMLRARGIQFLQVRHTHAHTNARTHTHTNAASAVEMRCACGIQLLQARHVRARTHARKHTPSAGQKTEYSRSGSETGADTPTRDHGDEDYRHSSTYAAGAPAYSAD